MLPQEEMTLFEERVRALLQQNADLRQQVDNLTRDNDLQRKQLVQAHAELLQQQKRYRELATAHALTADVERKEIARRRINALITKIDRTIELLNE